MLRQVLNIPQKLARRLSRGEIQRFEQELQTLRQRNKLLEDRVPPANPASLPTYDADFLRVWNKSVGFMRDQDFKNAYMAGMHTDHRQGRASGYPIDLHIEWRIHVCCWAAWHAAKLQGDFVECGTNAGIMSVAICNYLDFDKIGKKFYLFDTFKGIPEDQILDSELHAIDQNSVYRDVYDTAVHNFSPWKNIVFVKGKIPETLDWNDIPSVAYLMIDMNIVTPEKAALSYFWPKMVSGGVILFDDYGWLGYAIQKQAHDEFANSVGAKILELPTGQGLLIKP